MREGGVTMVRIKIRSSTSRRRNRHRRRVPRKGSRACMIIPSGRVDDSMTNEAGSAGPVTAPLNPDIRSRQICLLSSDSVLFISPTITRITRLCDSNIN